MKTMKTFDTWGKPVLLIYEMHLFNMKFHINIWKPVLLIYEIYEIHHEKKYSYNLEESFIFLSFSTFLIESTPMRQTIKDS